MRLKKSAISNPILLVLLNSTHRVLKMWVCNYS